MDIRAAPRPAFEAAGRAWTERDPLVIAEIGTSHGADPVKARELVAAAREAGAGCAKFQLIHAEEIIHPKTGIVPLPGGDTSLYAAFQALETPLAFYAEIKEYAESLGLLFLCTPFGTRSARELASLRPALLKSASPELNHFPLLAELGATGLPLIVSTGVSRLGDVEAALEALGYPERRAPESILLLHCVTAYPAPPEDYNLRAMANLGAVLGLPVGVSDHSLDPLLVPLVALASGACAVEKHFTLSKAGGGLDDPVALTPAEFSAMAGALKAAAGSSAEGRLAEANARFGAERVRAVLGDGVKRLAPSERANYGRTNRSLHVMRAISRGEVISSEDIGILRTEKVLRPGLPPEFLAEAIGRRAARDIDDGEGLVWADLGGRD